MINFSCEINQLASFRQLEENLIKLEPEKLKSRKKRIFEHFLVKIPSKVPER